MGRIVGAVSFITILGVGLAACGGVDKRAAAYRDKARERFQGGDYAVAVANYDQAIDNDKGGKLKGIGGERRRAVHEYVLSRLHKAWELFDRGNFEDAHDIVLELNAADAFDDKDLERQVVKTLGDLAASRMVDADRLADKARFSAAIDLAEFLVKPLPSDHSLRVRVTALKKRAVATHTLLMRKARGKPGSVAFHYLMTQVFGGDRLSDGIDAVRATKQAGGSASDYVASGRTHSENGNTFDAENNFVLARANDSGEEWDTGATKYFNVQWGIADEKILEAIWDGDPIPSTFPVPDKDALPAADTIDIVSSSHDVVVMHGYRALGVSYGLGTQLLDDINNRSTIGIDLLIPGKKINHRPAAYFESSSLGGGVSGWGAEWQIQKWVGQAQLLAGAGYWETSQVDEVGIDVPLLRARSIFGLVGLRYRVLDQITLGADYEANVYQLAKLDDPAYQHYSRATGRVFTPVPLLPQLHKSLAALSLEGFVSYAHNAPNDLSFGGELVYHKSMVSGDGGGDRFDGIEKSLFAIQTLIGPTIDLWFGAGTSILDQSSQVNGMGVLFRIPTDKPRRLKTVLEPSVWIESSGFGGDIGGWGIQFLGLKPFGKGASLYGYGLGYLANSQSDVPDGSTEIKQRAFYIPLIYRTAIGASLIFSAEFRGNLLQLGGSGDPGDNQAYSPLIGRIFTPLPVLSSMGGLFKKLMLEAHVEYAYGAPREVVFGGWLIYRPIVTDH